MSVAWLPERSSSPSFRASGPSSSRGKKPVELAHTVLSGANDLRVADQGARHGDMQR